MGKCKYCGLNAGFLKSKHKDCFEKFQNGKFEIIQEIEKAITNTSDFVGLDNKLKAIASGSFIKADEINSLMLNGFDNSVDKVLEDGILTVEEEDQISKFKEYYNLEQSALNKNGSLERIVKSSIIRYILEGQIPESKIDIQGNLPFNLDKSEKIIWLFNNSQFYEQTTRTEFHGRSQGISMRIAKGVYYRTSTFKGYPIKTTEMQFVSNGLTCLTDKHIYFASSVKSFKIPYNKIITIDPYDDGVGFQKDGSSAKPIVLKGIDSWFTYNVISNLTKL